MFRKLIFVFICVISFSLIAADKSDLSSIRLIPNKDIKVEFIEKDKIFSVKTSIPNPDIDKTNLKVSYFLLKDQVTRLKDGKVKEEVDLAISKNGNASLIVRIYNQGIFVGQRLFLLKNGVPIKKKGDKTKVITVTPFSNFSGNRDPKFPELFAYRDKLTADLVRNYKCVVLSRANGMSLATENAIQKISSLENEVTDREEIQAADFVISGYIKSKNRAELLISDISEEAAEPFNLIKINNWNYEDFLAHIVANLYLTEISSAVPVSEKETWFVLPVFRFDKKPYSSSFLDKDLSLKIELALQNSDRVKQLVDHNSIEKVFREHKIAGSGMSSGSSVALGKLLGAENMIMGVVSSIVNSKLLKIDLIRVSSKNGAVIGAASQISSPKNIDEIIGRLVGKIVSHENKYIPHNASRAQKEKEGKLYQRMMWGAGKARESLGAFYDRLSYTEAAYMLMKDDPRSCFFLGRSYLLDVIWYLRHAIKDPIHKRIAIDLLDKILCNVKESYGNYWIPLSMKATARDQISYDKGDDDEFLQEGLIMIDKHIAEDKIKVENAYIVKTHILKKLRKYQELLDFANQYKFTDPVICRQVAMAAKETGDKKVELKNLLKLDFLGPYRNYFRSMARYIYLLRHFKRTDEAIKFYEEFTKDKTLIFSDPLLEVAICYLEKNENKKAFAILNYMKNYWKSYKKRKGKVHHSEKEHGKRVDELLKTTGTFSLDEEKWCSPAELMNLKEVKQSVFYFQPIGEMSKQRIKVIEGAKNYIQKACNIKTEVLPTIPFPTNKLTFDEATSRYKGWEVVKFLTYAYSPKKDALQILFVSDKDLHTDSRDNTIRIYGAENLTTIYKRTRSDLVGKRFFHELMNGQKCPTDGCVHCYCSLLNKFKDKYKICEKCQLKYKKIDFKKKFEALQNKTYAPRTQQERKLMDEYKKQIEKKEKK